MHVLRFYSKETQYLIAVKVYANTYSALINLGHEFRPDVKRKLKSIVIIKEKLLFFCRPCTEW